MGRLSDLGVVMVVVVMMMVFRGRKSRAGKNHQ